MKKTLLAILLCLAMLAGNVHFAFAEETEAPVEAEAPEETGTSEENEAVAEDRTVLDSGTCGTDLTWILYEDGELVVSGSGDMVDGITESPWHSVRRRIKKVVIEDGVTSIGALAFYNCDKLEKLTIPESVSEIEHTTFYSCSSLKWVVVLNDDIWIEENAFEYASPVIYAHEGSAAEAFAAEHGMTFRSYTDGMEIPEGEASTGLSQEGRIDISNALVLGLSTVFYTGSPIGQSYEDRKSVV